MQQDHTLPVTERGEDTIPSAADRRRRQAKERGANLGRYVILEALGEGGMGVVYAAYDPELDRKVAIKLLHPRGGRGRRGDDVRARLLREAQALARLAHPNVVAVHDVGVVDDDVFVAMEFVDGDTLSAWLARERRSWRAVREVFLQAGRGLQAAHAAGLVHRDFKPDNVMIGRDGRVRVMDFGLARGAEVSPGTDDDAAPSEGAADLRLTRTGTILGTPLYMAPEQHAGRPADTRSDVFAFAVALHQGLYNERPFAGDTLPVLMVNTQRGAVRPPPPGSRVPAWLRKIVLRGLQPEPEARYPSMEALLADLGRDRDATLRKLAWVGAAAIFVAAAIAVVVSDEGPCEGARDPWAEVWSEERRAAVLGGQADADARAIAERLVANVDRQVAGSREARRDACLATHERGEQSPELLDRRMACLDRQRRATGRLLDALAGAADADALERALEASYRLEDASACADVGALLGEAPLPVDPGARERIGELRGRVAEAWMLRELGHEREGEAALEALVAEIRGVEYAPALIEALAGLAQAEVDVGEVEAALAHIDEGARLAAASGERLHLLQFWNLKSFAVGHRLARPEVGLTWADAASTLLLPGDPPRRRISLAVNRGLILTVKDDPAGARDSYRAALAISESELGADHPVTAKVVGNLGAVEMELGDLAAAEVAIERAIAITREKLGPRHSDLGHHLLNLSELARHRGDLAGAKAHCEASLQVRRERFGDQHIDVARSLANLSTIAATMGDLDGAAALLEESMAIQDAVLGPEHPDLIITAAIAGGIASERGRLDEAEVAFRRSLALAEAAFGAGSPPTVSARLGLAAITLEQGRAAEARTLFADLVAQTERERGPDHPSLHPVLAGLVEATLGVAPREALADAERLVALASKTELAPAQIAEGKLLLARALLAGKERRRAQALLGEIAAMELGEGPGAKVKAEAAALRRQR